MKKLVVTIAATAVMSVSALANGIDWSNLAPAVDRSGVTIPLESSIVVSLWRDGGNATIDSMSAMWTSSGDDTAVAGYTAIWQGDGYFAQNQEAYGVVNNGQSIFTRLEDSSGGGWYADVGPLTTVSGIVSGTETSSTEYYLPGTAQGDWHPVPEPATMALLGLGALTLGYRRLRK